MTPPSPVDFNVVDLGPLPSAPRRATNGERTVSEDAPSIVLALRQRFGGAVRAHAIHAHDQCVVWIDPARNLEILGWLKEYPEHAFDMMADVTAVDYGGGRPINVVYQMFSSSGRTALRVRCELPDPEPSVRSVTGLWAAANWLEREIYDLFGVRFEGHPDLRRILMPDDYAEGHPLRKDFPLRGRFSRAEQTRRALNQDLKHSYIASDLEKGGEPQVAEHAEDAAGVAEAQHPPASGARP